MTISTTNARNDYTGNNSTATYSYSYRIFQESNLEVIVKETATGEETSLVLNTDYSVTGVGSASGTIVLADLNQNWISGTGFLNTGWTLTIKRLVPLTQITDIRNQGDFYPEVHEDQFDKQLMISQQQQDQLDRAIKVPKTTIIGDVETTLPAPAADYVIGWNSTADALVNIPLSISTSVTEYDAIVGVLGTDLGATHATIAEALADATNSYKILVLRGETISTTLVVADNDVEIVFKRGVTLTKGTATIGIQVDGDDCRISNARLLGFSTSGDYGIKVSVGAARTLLDAPRFNNCDGTINDLGSETYITVEYVE